MESLYAISISGMTIYVKGSLSKDECITIESIAKKFLDTLDVTMDGNDICQAFIKKVNASLHISLVHMPVKYVFRIK